MNPQPYADPLAPAIFRLDTGEPEDEEPDYELEVQERLNKH